MSIVTNFGLIFKGKLQRLQMPAANVTTIINLSSIVNMSMGLITGPTLKAFGFRKVAFGAGVLFVGGVLATAFADTFHAFIVAYSVVAGEISALVKLYRYSILCFAILYSRRQRFTDDVLFVGAQHVFLREAQQGGRTGHNADRPRAHLLSSTHHGAAGRLRCDGLRAAAGRNQRAYIRGGCAAAAGQTA